ncbi:MAG: hypothetical protein AB7K71_06165 [Polyangiaceae bacterium]
MASSITVLDALVRSEATALGVDRHGAGEVRRVLCKGMQLRFVNRGEPSEQELHVTLGGARFGEVEVAKRGEFGDGLDELVSTVAVLRFRRSRPVSLESVAALTV